MQMPKATDNERAWSEWLAFKVGGQAEFATVDGSRVDILTDTHAIEVEWIKKQSQSIGQALFYAEATGRKASVILLSRGGKQSEAKYYLRCLVACVKAGISLEVFDTIKGEWR